ncbi:High osmolarity signaling protein SHO1, partial [Tetrabaena socialis]
ARLHIHPVGLFLLFFGLLSWVVALGGLGASTRDCITNRPPGAKADYCANSYQLEWWSIWFEFILLVVMILTCFTAAFERARHIYLTYLGMVTVLLTFMARSFITNSFSVGGLNFADYKSDAYNAAAAGAVLLCITNFALIIFVGLGAAGTSLGGAPAPMNLATGSSAPVEQKYQPST